MLCSNKIFTIYFCEGKSHKLYEHFGLYDIALLFKHKHLLQQLYEHYSLHVSICGVEVIFKKYPKATRVTCTVDSISPDTCPEVLFMLVLRYTIDYIIILVMHKQ